MPDRSPSHSPTPGSDQPSAQYAAALRLRMQQVNLSSYQALAKTAGVSKWQIEQLRQGKAAEMRVQALYQIATALQIPLSTLICEFSDLPQDRGNVETGHVSSSQADSASESDRPPAGTSPDDFQSQQREQLRQEFRQEFQQATLHAIESWLIQFPTAAYAAQQNPQLPAAKLLPLMRPIEQLLQTWGIEAIAPVGTELPYDPQQHQLMEGMAQPGDRVRVRYTGYRQGDRLLHRAKVSLAERNPNPQQA